MDVHKTIEGLHDWKDYSEEKFHSLSVVDESTVFL